MPIQYAAPFTLRAATEGLDVYVVGCIISTPTPKEVSAGEIATVTWKYKVVDGQGNTVGEAEYTEPASQVAAENPTRFATAHGILKEHGYSHAQDAGLPAGGTVI